jgi:hypothetical protein
MARKRRRRSAFVPRLIVPATVVGVVPACVLVSCQKLYEPAPTVAFRAYEVTAVPAAVGPIPDASPDAGDDG